MDIDKKTNEMFEEYSSPLELPYGKSISNLEDSLSNTISKIDNQEYFGSIDETQAKNMLNEDNLHPFTILTSLNYLYGNDWWDWEPETIKQTWEDSTGFKPNEIKMNQVGTLNTIKKTDKFWKDYRVHGWICNAWNNDIPDFRIIPAPTPGQILSTVSTVSLWQSNAFNVEIKTYIKETLKLHGASNPLSLSFIDGLTTPPLVTEYINARDDDALKDVLEEAKSNDDGFALKTIGMIDYYMVRLNMIKTQFERLLGGFHFA